MVIVLLTSTQVVGYQSSSAFPIASQKYLTILIQHSTPTSPLQLPPTPQMPTTVLITGSSSGLGLAFTHHYASLPTTHLLIALDTHPLPAPHTSNPKIHFHPIDITAYLRGLARHYANTPIDLIIHCAGVRGLVPSREQNVAAAETHDVMTRDVMLRTFETNAYGTFNVVQSFLPNLRLAEKPKVIVMASRMGSVASNVVGGGYAYRASKAALNAVVRSFSIDTPEVTYCLLHPGRVETGLVGWREEGAVGVEESVRDCLKVIEGWGRGDSGRLVDRFGVEIPW